MIDKINGNGSYDLPDHGSQKRNPALQAYENTPGAKEAAREAAKRRRSQELNGPHGKRSKPARQDQGVILDISANAAGKGKKAKSVKQEQSIAAWVSALRKFFQPVAQWLKNFWESDTKADKENDTQFGQQDAGEQGLQAVDISAAEAAEGLPPLDELPGEAGFSDISQAGQTNAMEPGTGQIPGAMQAQTGQIPMDAMQPGMDRIPEQILRTRNLHQIQQFLTQNGTKHPARNSDLLTYYDRQGKLVEIDETEKHRVLFGDKHVLKL